MKKYFGLLIVIVLLVTALSSCFKSAGPSTPITPSPIADTKTPTITSTPLKFQGSYTTPKSTITGDPNQSGLGNQTPTPEGSNASQSGAVTDLPTEDFGYISSSTQQVLMTQTYQNPTQVYHAGTQQPSATASLQATLSGPTATRIPTPSFLYTFTPAPALCEYDSNQAYETSLFNLINQLRASLGMPLLVLQNQLTIAALYHNEDMACNDFYDHIGSNGSTLLERVEGQGYIPSKIGENLYVGNDIYNDPQKAFDAWMRGPYSFSQMADAGYTDIGISYLYKADSSYGGYFTVVFGSPAPSGGQ